MGNNSLRRFIGIANTVVPTLTITYRTVRNTRHYTTLFSVETVGFHKISTTGNQLKFRCFMQYQWSIEVNKAFTETATEGVP